MKVAVILNAGAGSVGAGRAQDSADRILAAFAAVGVEVDLRTSEGAKLTETARAAAASGVDAVVAAGGDGTVSAVAAALLDGEVPLAVLPLGTRNHFARDLGLPDDLTLAARAIAARRCAHVDVGEVNGRIFINNSSIGLYPEIVLSRDAEQRRTGHGKWRAMATAAWRVLARFPLMVVRVVTGQRALITRTPFVFVGNNAYQISALSLGQRVRLDGGRLSLYMVRCQGRLQMFWLMVRAILQRLEDVKDFEAQSVTEARVDLGRRTVEVALDGEVASMAPPLCFRIRPGALPVLLAPAATEVPG